MSIKTRPARDLEFVISDESTARPDLEIGSPNSVYLVAKRITDVVLSLVAIVIALPVMIIIGLMVASVDGMPFLYRQKRVGHAGRMFWIYKFRSMYKDADRVLAENEALRKEYEKGFKLEVDPRITKIGRFLRKTSLDELPQLFNILIGDMSIVGPRPIVQKELDMHFGDDAKYYLAVKPGCAGIWQSSGRSDVSYAERIQMDCNYAKTANYWLDIKLILQTFWAIIIRKGAR